MQCTVWNNEKFTLFGKNISNKIVRLICYEAFCWNSVKMISWRDRIILRVILTKDFWINDMSFYCTVWKIEKFTVTQKKNSSNQLFSIFFSKYVTFTKFFSKMCDSKFPQFPHCVLIYSHLKKFRDTILL